MDGIPVVLAQGFLNQGTGGQRIKKCQENIASRKKREIRDIVEGSDDLTDEDFRLFYNSLETDFISLASLDKKMHITIRRPRSSRSGRKNRRTVSPNTTDSELGLRG